MVNVLVFGEVLFDIIRGSEYPGGAPFNFVINLQRLGVNSLFISKIGEDKLGKRILKLMEENNLSSELMQIDNVYKTGTVDVILNKETSPDYIINKPVAYDFIQYFGEIDRKLNSIEFDVFYFGTVAQRSGISRSTLFKIFQNVNSKKNFYDINLRKNCWNPSIVSESLHHTDILKINDDEIITLSETLYEKKFEEKEIYFKLKNDYKIQTLCVTKGEKGCTIYENDNATDIDGFKVAISDTVGAGDAFSAGFVYGISNDLSIVKAAELGNLMGSYVAGHSGAIPRFSIELKNKIDDLLNNTI